MDGELQKCFDNLVHVLEEEVKVYRVMHELVEQERDILVRAQIKELETTNYQKEVLIAKLRGLDRVREKSARVFGHLVGVTDDNPRLADIYAKLGTSKEGERLKVIHTTLLLLISQVKELNVKNEELVHSSLDYVSGALEEIKQLIGAPKKTYASSGSMKSGEVLGHFVSKDI